MTDLRDHLDQALESVRQWEREWGPYEPHPAMADLAIPENLKLTYTMATSQSESAKL